ncbi:MAG TPA: hypothetical protein VFI77_05225 [Gemmatimonadales bacterium]|nr:hypothetical protein [Gemmatimonadales bacterium]
MSLRELSANRAHSSWAARYRGAPSLWAGRSAGSAAARIQIAAAAVRLRPPP